MEELLNKFIECSNVDYITGISVLGGEPFQQNPSEILGLLKTLKDALNEYNVDLDSESIEDIERLHRIKVPYDLTTGRNADEDYDDNYFWFIDKNGKIQAIYQERDLKRKAKRFKYFLLEETDDEYKYIRKKAK